MISKNILDELKQNWRQEIGDITNELNSKYNTMPDLSILVFGQNAANDEYAKSKMKVLSKLGIITQITRVPVNASFNDAVRIVRKTVQSSSTVIIQCPTGFSDKEEQELLDIIPPIKDADCLSTACAGQIATRQSAMYPATTVGILYLIMHFDAKSNKLIGHASEILSNCKNAVVIGRGNLVGTPTFFALRDVLQMTVATHHSFSTDEQIIADCEKADVIVVATRSKMDVFNNMKLKENALVIDASSVYENGKIVGSLSEEFISNHYATPTPGGVGPLTVLGLADNVVRLCLLQAKKRGE